MVDDLTVALASAELVRTKYPVQGMQVTTVPGMPRWVAIKFGNGQWKKMPVTTALRYTQMLRAKARYQRLEREFVKRRNAE